MHVWNCKKICRPKKEGGVGIRRLHDLNNASGIRLVWKLCNSKSLWCQWMCAHYLQGAHISQVSASSLDSGTWKWLCSVMNLALEHMKRVGGTGNYVSLLHDKWLNGIKGSIASNFPNIHFPGYMHNWRVSDICANGDRTLKDQQLLPVWSLITKQQIPTDTADTWVWCASSSVNLSFKSAWELVRSSCY